MPVNLAPGLDDGRTSGRLMVRTYAVAGSDCTEATTYLFHSGSTNLYSFNYTNNYTPASIQHNSLNSLDIFTAIDAVNPQVPGSSPGRGAREFKGFRAFCRKPFFFEISNVGAM